MGDVAKAMLDGSACQSCGEWFDDVLEGAEPPGYPRSCNLCEHPRQRRMKADENDDA